MKVNIMTWLSLILLVCGASWGGGAWVAGWRKKENKSPCPGAGQTSSPALSFHDLPISRQKRGDMREKMCYREREGLLTTSHRTSSRYVKVNRKGRQEGILAKIRRPMDKRTVVVSKMSGVAALRLRITKVVGV